MRQKSNHHDNLLKLAGTLTGLKDSLSEIKKISDVIVSENMAHFENEDKEMFDKINELKKNKDFKGLSEIMKDLSKKVKSNNGSNKVEVPISKVNKAK